MNSRQWFFSGVAFLLQVPFFAYGAGLVPCGGTDEPACQTCYALGLINSVNSWLVGILSIAAAIMFIIAGFRIVTAQGNPSVLKSAKDMITNVAIGFMIVLAAWLFVDFLMKTLLDDGQSEMGPWNTIACVDQPTARTDPKEVSITIVQTTTSCYSIDDCAAKAAECNSRNDASSAVVGTTGSLAVDCSFASSDSSSNPPDLSAAGICDASLVAQYFPDQVGNAQCIIRKESVCGSRMLSTSDVMRNDGDRAFSFGPMQINLTWHELVGCGPNGSTLNCADAFRGRNYSAVVVDEALYQQCAEAAQNVSCGMTNGRRIQQRDGWSPWSTADGCGLN
jgi:hypothetical protein